MAPKKNKKHRDKEINPSHSKYVGPYQSNPYAKINSLKHVMEIAGHSPTQDNFTPLSESDNYFPSEEELSNQVITDRHSPTETKKKVLKIGLYILWTIVGAAVLTTIGLFYSHDLRISKSENKIETLNKDVESNSTDINDLKTDKKLFEYQLKELKESKKK